jgi:hypothetical protein
LGFIPIPFKGFKSKIDNSKFLKYISCDYRLYKNSKDGATKNDHFRAMLCRAKERRFAPECIVFDSWFTALDNFTLASPLHLYF